MSAETVRLLQTILLMVAAFAAGYSVASAYWSRVFRRASKAAGRAAAEMRGSRLNLPARAFHNLENTRHLARWRSNWGGDYVVGC